VAIRVHPTAVISPGAVLDEGVEVGPYCLVGSNVVLHENVKLKSHVVIEGYSTIGADTEIFQFASIGSAPQDKKFSGEASRLVLGKRNVIREYVTLQPGTAHGTMETIIGDDNLFMVSSHVAHDCRVGNGNVFANCVMLAGHVHVGSGAIFGGGAAVHQFARIGDLALLGGGAMVSGDVPPYAIMHGDHARIRGMNVIGLRRSGTNPEEMKVIKNTFRTLYVKGGSSEERLSRLSESTNIIPAAQKLIDFLSGGKRPLVVWGRNSSLDEE
jgi:UDP-N-acetylglucosamine acyltransferase